MLIKIFDFADYSKDHLASQIGETVGAMAGG